MFPEKKADQSSPNSNTTALNPKNIDFSIASTSDQARKQVTLESPINNSPETTGNILKSTLEYIINLPLPKSPPKKQVKPIQLVQENKVGKPESKIKKTSQPSKSKEKLPSQKNYTCQYCPKHFKSVKQLRNHIRSECIQTAQAKKNKQTSKEDVVLISVMKTRLKNLLPTELRYKCEKCGSAYRFNNVLQQHEMMGCEKGKLYLCPFCPIRCTHQLSLQDHLKAEHPQEIQNQ